MAKKVIKTQGEASEAIKILEDLKKKGVKGLEARINALKNLNK